MINDELWTVAGVSYRLPCDENVQRGSALCVNSTSRPSTCFVYVMSSPAFRKPCPCTVSSVAWPDGADAGSTRESAGRRQSWPSAPGASHAGMQYGQWV